MNPEIFRAYDIRGNYGKDFNADDAYAIARVFGVFVKKKAKKKNPTIVLSYDARESSRVISEKVLEGLADAGVNVIHAGETSTPMHYFAVAHSRADGGIMVTASHLGKAFNGFKLSLRGAQPISGEEFYGVFGKEAQKLGGKERLQTASVRREDFLESYCSFLGLSKTTYRALLRSKKIFFDTDGDRVFFRNRKGKTIRPDHIASLLAAAFLKKYKGARVILDARSSKVLSETIRANGGTPILSRAGHTFFKRAMRKHKAILGAELSGHYYFRDFFYCDSGLFAALRVLEIMKKTRKTIDELILPFQRYYQSGEINFKLKTKNEKLKILKSLEKYFRGAKKISRIDGLTVEYGDFWFNIRSSNTENLVRINLEATSKKILEERLKEIKRAMQKAGNI